VAAISAPLLEERADSLSSEVELALSARYHYLGRGRQAYAFESGDGKWVIKFFNQKYLRTPFWATFFPKVGAKREKRRQFFETSYKIAAKILKKETGILYLHQGRALEELPHLSLTDKGGRSHLINLNEVPFVLQKKAAPLILNSLSLEELDRITAELLAIVTFRIEHQIRDEDRNIFDNYGMIDGQLVHIDPGRLYFEKNPWNLETLKYEWWCATHRFKKWLASNAPDRVPAFEKAVNELSENF
jgi:hypothetical protein